MSLWKDFQKKQYFFWKKWKKRVLEKETLFFLTPERQDIPVYILPKYINLGMNLRVNS